MSRIWLRKGPFIWKSWAFSILVALLIAASFKSAIADWNVVPTGSMNPTIVEGDRIFVNKLAYDLKVPFTTRHLAEWSDPQRGDIVVFFSPVDGKRLVKRVVGLPGEAIALENNHLLVNGEAAAYEPLDQGRKMPAAAGQFSVLEDLTGRKHPIQITPRQPAPRTFGPVTVPEGHYLMMGDNRDNSADSRYFGFV
ncbi:MAG: signal peptidase I, partial [Deltaproteobacteria bacterium]|nr:signal peptidase I [Deltaproteobacteria bacterium]